MLAARLIYGLSLMAAALMLIGAITFNHLGYAQTTVERELQPAVKRALASRQVDSASPIRKDGYTSLQDKRTTERRPRALAYESDNASRGAAKAVADSSASIYSAAVISASIRPGTPLYRVLHTSQLSLTGTEGSNEQFVDRTGDLKADERTTFDTRGGSFDIAVGRSGARYEAYSAIDNKGTSSTSEDTPIGVLVVALDTNGDYVRDSSTTYDLKRDFNLPSAVAVVSGTSKAGREFVIVSSSGYYNRSNPNHPDNEPSAGVVLLVRDTATGGFDNSRSRELVRVGSNQLSNANALALLPNNDLLIADFDSNELRIIRDTNADGIPDTLSATPYYSYRYSDDAPLDIAANTRGVVFSHSNGNDTVMLALYDNNRDGRADHDEVVVEGLSIDNNLIFHGLTVDREGTVYVIEDATGAADLAADGGNGGTPHIIAFPDQNLDGFLRDGPLFAAADNPASQALSGLAFGALSPNQINEAQFFVRQHYLDFLDREPDQGGWDYWTNELTKCGNDAACINGRRIGVSAAFFYENEFQRTGGYVYRLYRSTLSRQPTYAEFTQDRGMVIEGPTLEATKAAYAEAFIKRSEFLQKYPAGSSAEKFVDDLLQSAKRTSAVDLSRLRSSLVGMYNGGAGRAAIVRVVADDAAFAQAMKNPSFVRMEYFGYLKRDPDPEGEAFWLNILNNKEPNNYRGMVCAFLTSKEYQERFGAMLTRSNTDCGP